MAVKCTSWQQSKQFYPYPNADNAKAVLQLSCTTGWVWEIDSAQHKSQQSQLPHDVVLSGYTSTDK